MMTSHFSSALAVLVMMTVDSASVLQASAEDFQLSLRSQKKQETPQTWNRVTQEQTWLAAETAVIVCDVWDKHHCLNAVRRLEEFAPRMNEVLKESRRRGATIIHSPSDCMAAYEAHPARQRAVNAPQDKSAPPDIAFWCSKIPAEEQAAYPIDQSDGGEDDDPAEHAKWAAELKALGRNPGMPWKTQSPLIEIDAEHDFISDRGDEVWNILKSRGIQNVILVGVHTNMCVLGRPFGLRQMVRGGKNVVLMRDMTDCMYNPKRWPFVPHFYGNDLIVSHVERFVCPTITSDQILGGDPFSSKYDLRGKRDVTYQPPVELNVDTIRNQWTTAPLGSSWNDATQGRVKKHHGPIWIRCTVRIPKTWLTGESTTLMIPSALGTTQAWMNGVPLTPVASDQSRLTVVADSIVVDDINLLVLRTESKSETDQLPMPPTIANGDGKMELAGRWQFRTGDEPEWSNIPLPAKFGVGSDVLFEVQ